MFMALGTFDVTAAFENVSLSASKHFFYMKFPIGKKGIVRLSSRDPQC